MFHYNKKVDGWSHEKIKGINQVWGNIIPTQSHKKKFQLLTYLQKYLDSYLAKNGKKITTRLNKISGQKNSLSDFDFFINSTPVSLHNAQKKFISIGAAHQFNRYPTIIIHELLHIISYQQIEIDESLRKKLKSTLSEKDLNELKEIITVLINEEFEDLIEIPDAGYPKHQKIREKVLRLWKKRNDFSDFIWQSALEIKKGE